MGNSKSISYNKAISDMKKLSIEDFYELNIFNGTSLRYEVKDMVYERVLVCAENDIEYFDLGWRKAIDILLIKSNDKIYFAAQLNLNHTESIKNWLSHKFQMYIDFAFEYDGNKFVMTDELLSWIMVNNYEVKISNTPSTTNEKIKIKSKIEFKCLKKHVIYQNNNEDIQAINQMADTISSVDTNSTEEGSAVPSAPYN